MQTKIWGAIGVASLAWGTTGVATRAALNTGVSEFGLVTVRTLLAAVLVSGYLIVRHGGYGRTAESWRTGVVMGITNLAGPFLLLTYAYANASAGFVGLLIALIPLVTAVMAHFMLPAERLHVAKVVGLVTALGGVALLLLSGDSGLESGGRPFVAFLLSGGGVVLISYASIYAKRRAATYDPVEFTATQFVVGAAVMVAATLVIEGIPGPYTAWAWVLLVYLTVAGSIVPFVAYFWVLSHVTAVKASLIGYVVPLVAIVAGIVLIDERLQFGIAAGGILILAGVVLTDRAERIAVTT